MPALRGSRVAVLFLIVTCLLHHAICIHVKKPTREQTFRNRKPSRRLQQIASASSSGGGYPLEVHSEAGCVSKTYASDSPLKPLTIPTGIWDIIWPVNPYSPGDDKYMYVLTYDEKGFELPGGPLWFSDNYGADGSWKNMNDHLKAALPKDASDIVIGVLDVIYHNDAPGKLLLHGSDKYNWITTDNGTTFKAIDSPGSTIGTLVGTVKTHPTQTDWLLAKAARGICKTDLYSKMCTTDLFVSKDFGVSWTNLTTNTRGAIAAFTDYDWGVTLKTTNPKFKDETILATVYEDPSHLKGIVHTWDKNLHFVVSHDLFNSKHDKLVPCGNKFEIVHDTLYIAVPDSCPSNPDGSKRHSTAEGSVTLFVSGDDGYSFNEACLPTPIPDNGYYLAHTHDLKDVFVIVDHREDDPVQASAPMGSVYASGNATTMFSLSLRYNFRRSRPDFARLEALPGAYMANILDERVVSDPQFSGGEYWSNFVQTRVSYNGGGDWKGISTPKPLRNMDCNRCDTDDPSKCGLHLHGPSSWFLYTDPFEEFAPDSIPSMYSHDSAPGIVLAAGNVGEYLDFQAVDTCTWLSRDGGSSWVDVANHAAIYEFGDNGGIIVMATYHIEGATDTLYLSVNEGRCWHKVMLEEAIDVDNIRVEPYGASHVFAIHGTGCMSDSHPKCSGDRLSGKLYVVDVNKLLAAEFKPCTEADYEDWSPGTCLLGANITYERRKQDAQCFNGRAYEREVTNSSCKCTLVDFECEFGFFKGPNGCEPIEGMDDVTCPAITKHQYYVSTTHQRLILGDVCSDPQSVTPDSDGSGHATGKDSSGAGLGGFFIFLIVLGVLSVLGGVWWSCFASDNTKEVVADTAAPLLEVVGGVLGRVADMARSVVGWVQNKIHGPRANEEAREAFFEPLAGAGGRQEFDLDAEDVRSPPLFPQ